jgi:hypothetical protein
MAPTAAETREAILRNARAAERERLRNLARTKFGDLTDDELDAKVRELDLEKLSRAGQAGRRSQLRNAEVGKTWLTLEDELLLRIEDLLTVARLIANPPTDEAAA